MFFPRPLGNVYEVSWKWDHFLNSRLKWVNRKTIVKQPTDTVFSYKNSFINKIHNISLNKEHPSQDENYLGRNSLDEAEWFPNPMMSTCSFLTNLTLHWPLVVIMWLGHRNKKCIEVATEEFLKGRLVLLLEIERPLSISHAFSKQSVFNFIKLSALFFSPLMLYFIFNPSILFLPVFAGDISLCHVFLFFDCFLAAAWWAVLHLLYYSYFDGLGL